MNNIYQNPSFYAHIINGLLLLFAIIILCTKICTFFINPKQKTPPQRCFSIKSTSLPYWGL